MTTHALTINFHGTDLFIIEQDGQPYTPMKNIVEGMGLDWSSQLTKINANPERWGMALIAIPTLGHVQEAVCLPLRKLFGWLTSIHPSRVKKELRDAIIYYQNECDDVLWNHWTKGETKYGLKQLPEPKTKKALPNGLTLEMQDSIKALVKARVEALPSERRAKGAITCWSALKSKFGCTYKEISPEEFTTALSLVARVSLAGEYIAKPEPKPEPAPAEFLTDNDNKNIRRIIFKISKQFLNEKALTQGAWHSLRKLTGVKSPLPFETRHLPTIAAELGRILGIANEYSKFINKLEKSVCKTALRELGPINQLLIQCNSERNALLLDVLGDLGLDVWDKKEISDVGSRAHSHYDYPEMSEAS